MPAHRPTPAPHVAERRALRHLVLHDLDDVALTEATQPHGEHGTPWPNLIGSLSHPPLRPSRTIVTGPRGLERAVLDVITPLCHDATAWDGRSPRRAPDLLIGALPWRFSELGDVPDIPGPIVGPRPAILPLAFDGRSVSVGPVAGAGGPCQACVHPAFDDTAERPSPSLEPALFALAAGACGLFVCAFAAGDTIACSLSLTFDLGAPHVEHRLWSCAPTCRRAA